MKEPPIPQEFLDTLLEKMTITRRQGEVLIVMLVPNMAGTGVGFDTTTCEILAAKDDAIDALIGIQIRKLYQDVMKRAADANPPAPGGE